MIAGMTDAIAGMTATTTAINQALNADFQDAGLRAGVLLSCQRLAKAQDPLRFLHTKKIALARPESLLVAIQFSPENRQLIISMKKLICILASAALLGACEQKTTTVNPPADKKTDSNTTIVNPPAEKKTESNTTIVNPAAEKTETTTTVTASTPNP